MIKVQVPKHADVLAKRQAYGVSQRFDGVGTNQWHVFIQVFMLNLFGNFERSDSSFLTGLPVQETFGI